MRVFALAAVSMLALAPAYAATAQQELMKTCNATASGQSLAGNARKTFMSTCLSGKPTPKPLTAQQTKMKTCNTQATGKTGDERKTFMASCLKG